MSRSLLLILLGLGGIVMDDASRNLLAQDAYPRVVGPTGHFYGPTQAHYQYQRQYGHPWYGGPAQYDPNTGATLQAPSFGWGGYYTGNLPFYGYSYGYQRQGFPLLGGYGAAGYAAYGWNGIQQYQVVPQQALPQFGPAPVFSWQQAGDPYQLQLQQQQFLQQQQLQRGQPQQQAAPIPAPGNVARGPIVGPREPVMQRAHDFMPANPSTVAQRQNSVHLQGQGDIWFRQQNFLNAYARYKQAAAAAPDLAAPHFRMAYALMALQRYELAVPELQRGIKLDPQYPLRGENPAQVYGEANRLGAAALPQAVAAWARKDIRSPDRLFLLGALLMISGDQARARILLETAVDFGGPADHLTAFLNLGQEPAVATVPQATPADDRPPVPEAVEKLLNDNQDWLPAKPLASRRPNPSPIIQSGGVSAPQPNPPPPAESPVARSKPAAVVTPVEPKASNPSNLGFVPIPKKGSPAIPTPAESEQTTPAASDTKPDAAAGPVIPIPGGGT